MSLTCDVLIVGGGGAALRAAIAAYERQPRARVLLVTKGRLGASGVTATACSDRMAFHATLPTTEPGGPEAWRHHADDIYRLGGRVSDYDLAEALAREAARAFDDLARWGVPWVRSADGAPDQFVTDGSRYARACYTGPYTANHIEQALLRRLRELPVQVLEHSLIAELLLDAGRERVLGAAALDERTGEVQAIGAGAVVLATGGAGQAFAVNVYPPDCTGDGYALAYRAGAELVNMEFIQLGLCSLRTGLACSGSMMRALPRLVNERDEEFLPRYFPAGTPPDEVYATLYRKGASWPVSANEPSHIIDIAVAAERAAGRRAFLDYARDPAGLDLASLTERVGALGQETRSLRLSAESTASPLARLLAINPQAVAWLAERGIALEEGERVEIAPAVQHFQGGVKIGVRGQTTLRGLYAAGEVAGGQHGANRPGGNALLDTQVMGRLAGEAAAAQALADPQPPVESRAAQQAVAGLFASAGHPAAGVRRRVRAAMSAGCGVRRTAAGLRTLVDELATLDGPGILPDGALAEAVETVNLLAAARLVACAALERDESRGPHLRFASEESLQPLPGDDARWERYLVLRRGADGPTIERRAPVGP